jgi:hypothetical protein
MESAAMAIEILDATYGDANNTLTSGQKSSSFQLLASYLVNASAATRGPQESIFHHHHETLILMFSPNSWCTYVRF